MKKILAAAVAAFVAFSAPTAAQAGYEHEYLNPATTTAKELGTDTDGIICRVLADDVTNIRPIYIDCADFAKLSGSTFAGTVTLDDGVGASPSFVMTDATDESLTISKVDAGYATMTTVAGDGVQITTGNLRVGNAASTQTLDGEDMYVEGVLENDGGLYLDGGLLVNTTNGTAISAIRFAFDAVASGGTSKTTTLTGATSSSRCVASAAETATNAVYIRSVVPGTNQVVITTSGDPGASNLDYTVICFN